MPEPPPGLGSNTTAVDVGEGTVSPVQALADHLLRQIPEDWKLRRPRSDEDGMLAVLARTGGSKTETLSAVLRWEGPIAAPGRPVVGRIDGRAVVAEGPLEAPADLLPRLRRALATYRR